MCTVVCFVFFFLMNPKYDISTLSTNTPVPCFAREMKLFVVDILVSTHWGGLKRIGGKKKNEPLKYMCNLCIYTDFLQLYIPSIIFQSHLNEGTSYLWWPESGHLLVDANVNILTSQ